MSNSGVKTEQTSQACKRCNKIFGEGRAFELGSHRWHVECFKCSTCDRQLDCNTNLLLLDNGALVCGNCSYYCSVCKQRIEGTAILAGDQAFCSDCFTCRNCKRKIKGRKYAKTGQGIFCMPCHETLLARKHRRQQQKTAQRKPAPDNLTISLTGFNADREVSDDALSNRSSNNSLSATHKQSQRASDIDVPKPVRSSLNFIYREKELPPEPVDHSNNSNSTLTPESVASPDSLHFSSHSKETEHPADAMKNGPVSPSGRDASPDRRSKEKDIMRSDAPYVLDKPFQLEEKPNDEDYRDIVFRLDESLNFGEDDDEFTSIPPRVAHSPPASEAPTEKPPARAKTNANTTNRTAIYVSESAASLTSASLTDDAGSSVERKEVADSTDVHSSSASSISSVEKEDRHLFDSAVSTPHVSPEAEQKRQAFNFATAFSEAQDEISDMHENRPTPSPENLSALIPHRSSLRSTSPRPDKVVSTTLTLSPISGEGNHDAAPSTPPAKLQKQNTLNGALRGLSPFLSPRMFGNAFHSSGENQYTSQDLFDIPSSPSTKRGSNPDMSGNTIRDTSTISAPVLQSSSSDIEPTLITSAPISRDVETNLKSSTRSGHQRSISDRGLAAKNALAAVGNALTGHTRSSSQSSLSAENGHRRSSSNAALTVDLLNKELNTANQKIAELELLLHRQSNARSTELDADSTLLDVNIQQKRNTIAELEARHVATRMELEVLQSAKEEASGNSVVAQFTNELERVKTELTAEISELMLRRDVLKQENDKAQNDLNKAIEESSLLNVKNTQLADMNNELTKQLIEKFSNYSNSPVPNFKDFKQKNRASKSSVPGFVQTTKSTNGSKVSDTSLSTESSETPAVTVLNGNGTLDSRKVVREGRGKFWKRPGAAMAKGLNKVFANDGESIEETISSGPYEGFGSQNGSLGSSRLPNSTSVPTGISAIGESIVNSTTNTGGLGVVLSNSQSNVNGSANGMKNGKHGWFNQPNRALSPPKAAGQRPLQGQFSLMGISLEQRVLMEGAKVPLIVRSCMEEVEKRGMQYEGIYRKSGAVSQRQAIEEEFERRQEGDFTELFSCDICAITSAVKQYLRNLPDPLITFGQYEEFIGLGNMISASGGPDQAAIKRMRSILNDLPTAHRDCLEYVVRHLVKVSGFSTVNLMTSKNLAVVFAPTLTWEMSGMREMQDMGARNDATQMLIDYCEQVFL